MAITRMQTRRQLYGLGSIVKSITKPFTKVAKKIVPKEIAGPLRAIAPFLPPGWREAAYLAGTAKSTGRISPMDIALVTIPNIKTEAGSLKPTGFGSMGTGETLGAQASKAASEAFSGIKASASEYIPDSIKGLFEATPTQIPDGMTAAESSEYIKNAANLEKISKGAGSKYLESVGIKIGEDALIGKDLLKQAAIPVGLGAYSYLTAEKPEDKKPGYTLADYQAEMQPYLTRERTAFDNADRGVFAAKGGRIGYADGDFVYPTDVDSAVQYIDPDTGKPISKEEWLRRSLEEEGTGVVPVTPTTLELQKLANEQLSDRQREVQLQEKIDRDKLMNKLTRKEDKFLPKMLIPGEESTVKEDEFLPKMLIPGEESTVKEMINSLLQGLRPTKRVNQGIGGLTMDVENPVQEDITYKFNRPSGIQTVSDEEGPAIPADELNKFFKKLLEEQGKPSKPSDSYKDFLKKLGKQASTTSGSAFKPDQVEKMREYLFKLYDNPDILQMDPKGIIDMYQNLGADQLGVKNGGRIMANMGGVMVPPIRRGIGGISELDARETGGFIPMGMKEKKDDVPAMLAKNEFVMTADAVRGIGKGDVNKGAQILQNVMKQAEQVGKIA